jgi:hypothetical protein
MRIGRPFPILMTRKWGGLNCEPSPHMSDFEFYSDLIYMFVPKLENRSPVYWLMFGISVRDLNCGVWPDKICNTRTFPCHAFSSFFFSPLFRFLKNLRKWKLLVVQKKCIAVHGHISVHCSSSCLLSQQRNRLQIWWVKSTNWTAHKESYLHSNVTSLIFVWPCIISNDSKEEIQLDATITVYW